MNTSDNFHMHLLFSSNFFCGGTEKGEAERTREEKEGREWKEEGGKGEGRGWSE